MPLNFLDLTWCQEDDKAFRCTGDSKVFTHLAAIDFHERGVRVDIALPIDDGVNASIGSNRYRIGDARCQFHRNSVDFRAIYWNLWFQPWSQLRDLGQLKASQRSGSHLCAARTE